MSYLALKLIHILSSTILLGAGFGSAYFMFMANRRKDTASIYMITKLVIISEWLFIAPAIMLQIITGLWMLYISSFELTENWVLLSIGFYIFAGICWVPVLWMQVQMRNMAKNAVETTSELPEKYWIFEKYWVALGSLAFPSLVIIYYLMVMKPNFL